MKYIKEIFVLVCITIITISILGFRIGVVDGESMTPKFKNTQKFIYMLSNTYQIGDVVVIKYLDHYIVKRVVAKDGDLVIVDKQRLYVNNHPVAIEMVSNYGKDGLWKVPQNEIFVMGDNANESEDSRVFGSLPSNSVVGRVVFWKE